jgi:hypothetical protein
MAVLYLVLSLFSSWATRPAFQTEGRPPNAVVTLGKLLKGRVLLTLLKEKMPLEEAQRILGKDYSFDASNAGGWDVSYHDSGLSISYSHYWPNEQPQGELRVRGCSWWAFGVRWVHRDFWDK